MEEVAGLDMQGGVGQRELRRYENTVISRRLSPLRATPAKQKEISISTKTIIIGFWNIPYF